MKNAMTMNSSLVPVKGCWVMEKNGENPRIGMVTGISKIPGQDVVHVRWHHSKVISEVPVFQLKSGFKVGMDVEDVPYSRVKKSLGEGVIVSLKSFGGRDLALVEFPEKGELVWLPYENLRHIKGVMHRFRTGDVGGPESAERFRLKNLAHALELWNENTGSLSRFDIDPLPHQIHLVHHILASGNLNWLIADDVGLGKTIEVGLLFAALNQRKQLGRVLLVTPAGLTKQWQDELQFKFGMDDFRIYGDDFVVNEPQHWKLYDRVIGSMDRFKEDSNLAQLLAAPPWDIIVFDEGHRLTRRQYGQKYEASQRFKLAAELRKRTDSIILLSATPHQGKQDKFQALLELLRPEWKREIMDLALNPEIIRHMMIRNNKADVTDAEGEFIFKGKTTKAVKVESGFEAREFDKALQEYLQKGYSAAGAIKGITGRAIGFVMTVYRKLASSSAAAIHQALVKRLARLKEKNSSEGKWSEVDNSEVDARYEGEQEEKFIPPSTEFFSGEISLLLELIDRASVLVANDLKLQVFLGKLVPSIHEINPAEKVLIFTEYRSTQQHLANALQEQFGTESVELIHGSINHKERRAAIERFEDRAMFLISTEAGGEGLNLHRQCHVMINYDLPWNPMRIVQRIGRLYRYGQKHNVVVFNIHAPQTIDAEIIQLMYERINQVVQDLSHIGDEFRAGLEDDILGQFADLIDVKEILEQATVSSMSHTQEKIEEALARAREATMKHRELFEHVASFDPDETKNDIKLGEHHLKSFVDGMFRILGIEITGSLAKGEIVTIRLPDAVADELPHLRKNLQVTFNREIVSRRPHVHMLDLDSLLVKFMLRVTKKYEFGGKSSVIKGVVGDAVSTCILRWQNDQGKRMRQEFTSLLINAGGEIAVNPASFTEWLGRPAEIVGEFQTSREQAEVHRNIFENAVEKRFCAINSRTLHPENRQWIGASWVQC